MLRKHFNATTAVAIVALVFAMTGGAFAVTSKVGGGNASIAAKKKGKSKVLRGPAGPRGPEGKQGPAGPVGPAGPAGAKGETGAEGNGKEGKEGKAGTNGTNGTNGKPGVNGKSVTVAGEPAGANCKEGGSSFEEEGSGKKTYACNGSPWTAGGTLPKGATETGTWAISALPIVFLAPGNYVASVPISFTIPLAAPIASKAKKVHIILFGETPPTGCGGTVAEPTAESGNLCIFQHETPENVQSLVVEAIGEFQEASKTGVIVTARPESSRTKEGVYTFGSWALTG